MAVLCGAMASPVEEVLLMSDGKKIVSWRWAPSGEQKGVVVIVHGMCEHINRKHVPGTGWIALAEDLCSAGYTTVAYDMRYHGKTDPQHKGFMPMGGGDMMTRDITEIWRQTLDAHGAGGTNIILGHSCGSMLVQQACGKLKPAPSGMVLSGCPSDKFPVGLLKILNVAMAAFPGDKPLPLGLASDLEYNPRLGFPAEPTHEWLSTSKESNAAYRADDMCGHVACTNFWRELTKMYINTRTPGSPAYTSLPKTMKVLALIGEKDPCAGFGLGGSRTPKVVGTLLTCFDSAGGPYPEVRVYAGKRHELFNETNAADVREDLKAWIAHVKAPGAGAKL